MIVLVNEKKFRGREEKIKGKKDPNGRKKRNKRNVQKRCLSRKDIGARPEMYHVEETVIEHVSADIQHVFWHRVHVFPKNRKLNPVSEYFLLKIVKDFQRSFSVWLA